MLLKYNFLALCGVVFGAFGEGLTPPDSLVPLAKIGQSIIACPGDSVTLDGWASIGRGAEIMEWHWVGSGALTFDIKTDRGDLRIAAPMVPRVTALSLIVTDSKGRVSKPDCASLCVMKSEPRVSIGADSTIKVGVRIAFDPHVLTICGAIVKYEWDLDDDGIYEYVSSDNAKTSKAYFRAGSFKARFRATDSFGRTAGGMKTIVVLLAGAK